MSSRLPNPPALSFQTGFLSLLALWWLALAPLCGNAQTRTDRQDSIPVPYSPTAESVDTDIESSSRYLVMRDSVRIAVDVHLPAGRPDTARLPAILWQTRYWRSIDLRWPFSMIKNEYFLGRRGKFLKRIVRAGYALVVADSRGSGASFGRAPCPWHENEVADGAEIATWITEQPWSNQNIGAVGVSYSGTTADFLATTGHPNVKAVACLFSLYDVYDDIAFPGGVHFHWFTKGWNEANQALDHNRVPGGKGKLAVKGVRPVDDRRGDALLNEAVAMHDDNYDVHALAMESTFRDDVTDEGLTVDVFSPHSYAHRTDAGGAAVYSVSGYYDGCYQHAAIKRHLTLTNPQNKLLLGPWEHGGQFNGDPYVRSESEFELFGELMKFFDFHLKEVDNGLYDEPRVHYFTQQASRWNAADTWPPRHTTREPWYLRADTGLAPLAGATGELTYRVDTTHGTGPGNRWAAVFGKYDDPAVPYTDRAAEDRKLLVFDSKALPSALEITGHAVLNLRLRADRPYGNVFVYLEEVAPDGRVRYITEGQLKLLHRAETADTNRPTADARAVPARDFEQQSALPVVPGRAMDVRVALHPVSYEVPAGHRLRVALGGADRDYFRLRKRQPPVYTIVAGEHSFLELPLAR